MNLPASASSFLPSFIGLYVGLEHLFPHTYPHPSLDSKMPMIHLYCFSTKSDDNAVEQIKICEEISRQLRADVRPEDKEVKIWPVRDVAPMKRMFCASFRLPAEVAFRKEGIEGKI
jgi:tRNA (guanine37-N1)-methyltransferase